MAGGRRFVRFAAVGCAGFIVDVGVLYALEPWLGWYAGRVLSFLAAATATWEMNRRWTFPDLAAASGRWRQYLGYVASMLGGAAINYAVYAITLQHVEGRLAPALGVALGSIAGLVANYLSARFVIFRRGRD